MLLYRESAVSVLDSCSRFATWKVRYEKPLSHWPGDLAGGEGVTVKSNTFDFSETLWIIFQVYVSSRSRRRRNNLMYSRRRLSGDQGD